MKALCKQNCFNGGIAEVGDIIKVENLNEYLVKIEGKLPKCSIETRGPEPALVCAHNLPFPKCKHETAADDFEMLYRSHEKSPVEFWSITVTEGTKAVLKVLSLEAAAKLFDKLPQKLTDRNYLFSFDVFKRQQEQLQKSNSDFKQSERERIEAAEMAAEGPRGRMMAKGKKVSSSGNSTDPHELLK